MLGYFDNEAETQIIKHEHDGRTWIHSGDTGYIDEDGFVYFKSRIKRIYMFVFKPIGLNHIIFLRVSLKYKFGRHL